MCRLKPDVYGLGEQATDITYKALKRAPMAQGSGPQAPNVSLEGPLGRVGAIETRGKDPPKHLWPWGEGHRHSRKDGSFIEVSRLLHGALPLAFAGQTAPVHRAQ